MSVALQVFIIISDLKISHLRQPCLLNKKIEQVMVHCLPAHFVTKLTSSAWVTIYHTVKRGMVGTTLHSCHRRPLLRRRNQTAGRCFVQRVIKGLQGWTLISEIVPCVKQYLLHLVRTQMLHLPNVLVGMPFFQQLQIQNIYI